MFEGKEYLIMSKKWTKGDGIVAWWRPNGAGYTNDLQQAGRYDEAEAKSISETSHGDNVAVPMEMVLVLYSRHTVDLNDGLNRQKLLELVCA